MQTKRGRFLVQTSLGQFVRLSTNLLAERDRIEITREVFGRMIMKLEFEPMPQAPFAIDKVMRALPDCGVSFGTISATDCRRTPQLIDSDDLILTVMLTGSGTLHARGREILIRDGSAALSCSDDPHRFQIHTHADSITFRFNRRRLTPFLKNLDVSSSQDIPSNSDALRLLVAYAGALRQEDAILSLDVENAAVGHLYDLAALALDATRDAAAAAEGRGARTARLLAIKSDVDKDLENSKLSASSIAARHGISVRYLHMLFEPEGVSFSQYVLGKRLAHAHCMLRDNRFSDRGIARIALDVGFGDLSYFNRTFRRRYGASPTEVRHDEALSRKSAPARRNEPAGDG